MAHDVEKILHLVHDLVKLSKAVVVKVLVVLETPLTTAPVVTPIVALAREVNPFRMAEFVAHRI